MEVEPHNSALHVDVLPPPSEEDSNHCNGLNDQLESEGGNADNLADGTLSPTSLRRSTRVSALKAQKKLKTKDGEMVEGQRTASVSPNAAATTAGHATKDMSTAKAVAKRKLLKRKLSDGGELDQYDCKFGIRLDSHGDVYVMSDESDISSLNDEEVGELRQRYDSWRNQDVPDEVKEQRRIQLRELDVLLQQEEANLALMRKLRANQLKALLQAADKRPPTTAAVGQHAAGANAYKPAVATLPTNHNAKLNGTSHNKVNNKSNANRANSAQQQSSAPPKLTPTHMQQILSLLMAKASTPQQLTQLMKSLPSNFVSQLIQANMQQQPQTAAGSRQPSQSAGSQAGSASRAAVSAAAQQQQQQAAAAALAQQQQQQAIAAAQAAAAAEAKSQAAAKAAAETLAIRIAEVQHNNAQRIASARIQLRRYMEQQLQQLSLPKPSAPELSFVPNANQPDFYTMLGLDLVVQRVRKDKTIHKKWESEPYVCEQCSTDFTPAWEAIEGNNGEYHLYCRQCVRQAQKRKNRTEHNNLFKCAFSKIKDQEKEFEKQVAAGKFSDPIPTTIPGTNTTNSVTTTSTSANSSAIGVTTTAASAAASNRSAAAQQQQSGGGGSASSSHSHHYHHTGGSSAASQVPSHHQPHYAQQGSATRNAQQSSSGASTPQRGAQNLTKKRSSNTSSGTGGSGGASTSNSGASSSNATLQLMNAMRNNPAMVTAIVNTPMMAQNIIQLMSQRGGQGAASNNAILSAIMAHMAQASQSPQQHSSTSSGGSSSGGHHAASGGGNSTSRNDALSSSTAAASINPMWALNTQLNASTLLNSPQLREHMRQLQQAQMFATASKKK